MKQLLAVSIEAAKRGGHEVKRVREMVSWIERGVATLLIDDDSQAEIGEKSKGKTHEGANNPVTDGDMLSHRAMYYGILKAFPHVHVISEEDDPKPVDMAEIAMPRLTDPEVDAIARDDMVLPVGEVDVWIDPLDATQEYTENLLHFVTTMVCVAVRGKPVMGVIYKPFDDEVAWGWAGPDHVSPAVTRDVEGNRSPKDNSSKDLSKSRIIVSRSHAGKVHDVAEKAFGPAAEVTPAGGAGYKSWEVVKGNQDAYVHVTLIKKWDICAGNAILKALGGRLTTLGGEEVDYGRKEDPKHVENRGGVLATMHDHRAYLEALKDAVVT
jgi:inositol monophosphatase 3